MIASLRAGFNRNWTPEHHRRFLATLEELAGCPVPFRICETPCFLPQPLVDRLVREGAQLIDQLSTPEYHAASERSVPASYRVPNETAHPNFVQVDFGLDRGGNPKLVEIQGFPSLYGFQTVLARAYRMVHELPPLRSLLVDGYEDLLRRVITGGHDPADVVLLEIDPLQQKTLPDFLVTEKITGVRPVCITEVRRNGRRLEHRGRPIRRIYNRVIIDEVERKAIEPGFDFRDEFDVEWAGHPNYYFRISKFSLPYLRHPSVPRTWFLNELDRAPDDLENFVLKPLYSFAGLGVVVGPTRADLDAVRDRDNWILQERIDFAPVIETPHGATKAEIRVMYIWPDDGPLEAVCFIIRMGRGKMMGVDHNRDMEWVGASAAFCVPDS